MVEDLKWFQIQSGDDVDPSKLFTLGRLESKEAAIIRFNCILTNEEPSASGFTGKERLLLLEGNGNNKKSYPLIIIGDGKNRIARIGS